MPRDRQRVCLQDGIKLDINDLARRGFIRRGEFTSSNGIRWNSSHGGHRASAFITADMRGDQVGWFQLSGNFTQHIGLMAAPRRFGGHQWYFICPVMNRRASVLYRPNGANRFCSRQTWGRQVAYQTQFLDRDNRAHYAQSKIKNALCRIGGFNPDEWDLPPKPKWMRQRSYAHFEARFDRQDNILDQGLETYAARLLGI